MSLFVPASGHYIKTCPNTCEAAFEQPKANQIWQQNDFCTFEADFLWQKYARVCIKSRVNQNLVEEKGNYTALKVTCHQYIYGNVNAKDVKLVNS